MPVPYQGITAGGTLHGTGTWSGYFMRRPKLFVYEVYIFFSVSASQGFMEFQGGAPRQKSAAALLFPSARHEGG